MVPIFFDIYARRKNCTCIVMTKTERGTYQDAWSRKEYDTEREARIAREQEILEQQKNLKKYMDSYQDNMYKAMILTNIILRC